MRSRFTYARLMTGREDLGGSFELIGRDGEAERLGEFGVTGPRCAAAYRCEGRVSVQST
jgi:hypothetical protein